MRIQLRDVFPAAVLLAAGVFIASLALARGDEPRESGKAAGEAVPFRPATCDIYKVTGKLAETERFTSRINDRQRQLREQLEPMERELRELADRLRGMGDQPRGPEAEALMQQFNEKGAALRRAARDADEELTLLLAHVSHEAYREVIAAVDVVAEKRGYTHVFASQTTEDMRAPSGIQQFVQGMLSRPLVRAPQSDDITFDVLAELKLQ
jgi:Skp family chaperone for outer membrane proteins